MGSMSIQRLRVSWSGTGVTGPGVTTFYGVADGTMAIQVGAAEFFSALDGLIPVGTTLTIPGGGDLLDEATGELEGTWGSAPTTTINCAGSGNWAAGVGARVAWETGTVRGGRRVRGSTFVVPLTVNSYESNGSLSTTAMGGLNTAVDRMMTQAAANLVVWSRPRPGLAGAAVPVSRGVVPDRVSWLRSRRT